MGPISKALLLAAAGVALAAGCSSSTVSGAGDAAGDSSSDDGGNASDDASADASAVDATVDGSGDARSGDAAGDAHVDASTDSGVPQVPTCRASCNAPADCAIAGAQLYDASHYACNAGVCEWLGCKSTAECTATFQKTNYACEVAAGGTFPTCNLTCHAPSDCVTPNVAIYDASHYACNANRCEWLGCRSNTECASTYRNTAYACGAVSWSPVPTCYLSCGAPADCVTPNVPLYDATHYACNAGHCDWLGCRSASECVAAFQKPSYTCR